VSKSALMVCDVFVIFDNDFMISCFLIDDVYILEYASKTSFIIPSITFTMF